MSNTASKQTTFRQNLSQQRSSGGPAPGQSIPDLAIPDLANPDLTNPDLANPDLANPDLANPDQSKPEPATADQSTSNQATPDLANGATNGLPGAVTRSAARWTFLSNHAHVLAVLHSDPQLVLRQVAMEVGITERAVQRITQDLEEGGFIRREKVGRKNRYFILTNEPLRHPIEAHRKIGDLLKLISK